MKRFKFGKAFAAVLLLIALCIPVAFSALALDGEADANSEQTKKTIVLYEEDFDDITDRVDLVNGENTGAADGWTFVKNSSNGAAYIEGGKLHLAGSKYDVVYRTGENWSNYTLEADIYYKSETHDSGWAGMIYNVQNENTFQKAGLNPNKGYSLNGMLNGSWKNNVSGVNRDFKLPDTVTFGKEIPVRLKVVTAENVATFSYAFLNDDGTMKSDYTELLTIDNIIAETLSGSIGFMTSTGSTKFASIWVDNVKVTAEQPLESDVLYEEDFNGITDSVDLGGRRDTESWTFAKKSDNAAAYVENGKLYLSGNNYDVVYRTGENWKNYTLEADIYYNSATASSGWAGMLYNVQSADTFQKAGLNPNRRYSLNGRVNGSWKNDVTGINKGFTLPDDVTFGEGIPVRLKVVAYNNNAIFYYALLNDDSTMKTDYVKLLTIDNIPAETLSGSIGFMTATATTSIWVDNIKVSNIAEDDLLLLEPGVADIYEPESGIVNPPVVVEKLTSALPATEGERAAVVIAELDNALNVLGKDGAVLTTAEEFIDTYRKVLIPAFVVDSEAEADALAALMKDKNLIDAYVVAAAENASLVRRVRMANETTNNVSGALIFGDLNSDEARSEARELVVDNMSYVAISTAPITEETAFYFAKRQVAAWCYAENTAEIYRGIANGYHGIVSESSSAVYDVYESITQPTVSGRPVVIAHRGANSGASIKYPENTLMGIRAAKEVYGADCVEIDFGLTKDGYVILMHDGTVDRTTNGEGNFSDFTLEEIKALTVDIVPGKETTVPTLEEVLVLAKELDIVLYCHVKTVTDENIAAFSYLVDKYDCKDRALLFTSSFDKYNSNTNRVVTGTAYGLTDAPVLIDGIQFSAGNQKILSSYSEHIDGVIAMRQCLNKYNFQPLFYPYQKQGDMWGDETFYYQLCARGFVNTHSITDGQELMDSTALTRSGAVGWLTNHLHRCDDYHYAIDLTGEKLDLKIGQSINLSKTLELILGTAYGKADVIQIAGPALNSDNTLSEEGTITVVYSVTRVTDGGTSYAVLSEPVNIKFGPEKAVADQTPHGSVSEAYSDADKYPFALFIDGEFKGAFTHFANTDDKDVDNGGTNDNRDVIHYAKNLVQGTSGAGKTAIIYLRRDYALDSTAYSVKDGVPVNESYANLSQIGGTVIIDLGGNTLTLGSAQFLNACAKPILVSDEYVVNNTEIKFANGTVELNGYSFIKYSSTETLTDSKNFDFTFENVTFVLPENVKGASLIGLGSFSGSANVLAKVDYIDCTFDLSRATAANAAFTLFGIDNEGLEAAVTVKGGKIIANEDSFSAITIASIGVNGDVAFVADENGSYVKLYMPAGDIAANKTIPTDNADKYFVRTGADEYMGNSYSVYSLAEKSINEFVPKMSLTLDRDLILNVYVPAKAFLNSFSLDGVEYADLAAPEKVTLGDAEYYLVKISLDAKSAARDVVLRANVNIGDKSATGTFTFSIIKYAEKILADGSDVEKTLVKDVLSYVRAAYAYFKTEDAETVSRINAILGENYDENNAPAIEGSTTVEASGLKSATFSLDGTPNMRFYLADGADASKYSFFIDGTRVKTETSADGTYIDIDVYAYALCETVTYTVDGVESGSFHIGAYYEWSKTQNNEALVNLVARFWKYLQSARAYRDSVVKG